MNVPSFLPARSRGALVRLGVAALAIGCTEPSSTTRVEPAPVPPLDARVEWSDSLARPGAEVRVTVRLVGTPVASVTARLSYDSLGLAFAREESLDDGATRVIHAMPGLLRLAAIAPRGFADGRLHSVYFTVRRAEALRSLRIVFDEVHTVMRADARTAVVSRSP